uniref:Uncharacterized protein n=1 Tax=Knipowitschia caucasica TaxID=637954 RepID=A0AAV2LD26_KNICA
MKRSYPSGSDKRKRKKEEDEKRKHDSGLLRKCLVPSSSSNQEHASSSQSAATHTTTVPSTATPRFTAPSTALDSSASSSEQQSAISHTAMVNISSPTSIDQEDQTEPQAPTPAQTTSTDQEKATPIRLTSSDPGQWPDVLNDGEKSSLVKKGPLQGWQNQNQLITDPMPEQKNPRVPWAGYQMNIGNLDEHGIVVRPILSLRDRGIRTIAGT